MMFSGDDSTTYNKNGDKEVYDDTFVKQVDKIANRDYNVKDREMLKRLMYSLKVFVYASNDLLKKIVVDEQSNFKDVNKVVPIYISNEEYNMICKEVGKWKLVFNSKYSGLICEVNTYYQIATTNFKSILYKYPMIQLVGYPSIAMEKNKKFIDAILSKSGGYLSKDHQKLISEKNIAISNSNSKFSAIELVSYVLISSFIMDRAQNQNRN